MENNKELEEKLKENIEGNPQKSILDISIGDSNDELFMSGNGWNIAPIDESPSKGEFLPLGTIIKIKSAITSEIKHYSTMDDTKTLSVEKHIDEIMSTNCKVILPDGTIGDNKDLTYFDRLHYLFMIRDKTMMNYGSARLLKQTIYNPKKPKESKVIVIDHKIFRYYDIKNGIKKWYDRNNSCFNISDEESKINVNIYIPTIGVIDWIKNYVREKEIAKRDNIFGVDTDYDEFFMKILQYLVPNHRVLETEGAFEKYKSWWDDLTIEHNDIIIAFISKLKIGIQPTILIDFQGGEVEVALNFREYRSIFSISDRSEVLFSDM